jgi:hypothetical protein
VRIGFHLTPFWSPTDRAPTAIIDETIGSCAPPPAWASPGSIGHLALAPDGLAAPDPAMLARLAPEAGEMRLK